MNWSQMPDSERLVFFIPDLSKLHTKATETLVSRINNMRRHLEARETRHSSVIGERNGGSIPNFQGCEWPARPSLQTRRLCTDQLCAPNILFFAAIS